MRRTPIVRGPWQRKRTKPWANRITETPRLPKDWRAIRNYILWRDNCACRQCGAFAGTDAIVDHVVPRQLAPDEWRDEVGDDDHSNLTVLCHVCAGRKVECERALFSGYGYRLDRWIEVLKRTGPVPSREQVGEALARLRQLLNGTEAPGVSSHDR